MIALLGRSFKSAGIFLSPPQEKEEIEVASFIFTHYNPKSKSLKLVKKSKHEDTVEFGNVFSLFPLFTFLPVLLYLCDARSQSRILQS